MVWTVSMVLGWAESTIRHSVSTDGGASWSEFTDLPLYGVANSRAAMDACGDVHVVVSIIRANGMTQLVHHRLGPEGWVVESPPSESPLSMEPALGAGPDGELFLTWVEFRRDPPKGPRLMTVISRLRGR